MNTRKRHAVYFLLALIDVCLIAASYFLASDIYVGSAKALGGLSGFSGRVPNIGGPAFLVMYSCALVVFYAISRVYGCVYLGQLGKAAKRVLAINVIGVILFALLLFMLHMDSVSRMTLAIFCFISTAVVLVKNWITFRIFYRLRSNNKRIQPTVVIGCGSLAQRYATTIDESQTRLEDILGYVSPTPLPKRDGCFEEGISQIESPDAIHAGYAMLDSCPALGAKLGAIGDLESILSKMNVKKLVIALDPNEYSDVATVMAMADKFGTALELVPFYNDVMPQRPEIDAVRDVKLVNLRSMPLSNPFNAAAKRLADIVVSGLIIVLFSWLYVIVAIGVKVSSPGSILFKQKRVGRNNKIFSMLKFRSMRVNNESDTAWSTDEDPRKTRFGSFIRKFSLDEFPQFFNVFVGDMSIVGPRPEIPYHVKGFREEVPRYMLRHQVRPGITGWAQINGMRGNTSIEKRIELDLWYIENWSPQLDIRIFLRTLLGGFINSEKLVK